jgi:ferric-dicitrate binding protein FerR (iron transport regulator)
MPPASRRGRIFRISRTAAAAILLFTLAGTAYIWVNKKKSSPGTLSQAQRFKNDVQPGGNKALLKLSNGSTIVLDDAANGSLAIEGNTHVIKKDGAVLYDAGAPIPKGGSFVYNDISTPAAGQYRLTLPDGTKVWLDASSGIHFPTSFPTDTREVEVRGQVYFEVANNASKPFRVKVKNEWIVVLGTHFNINAYDDEQQIRTTLAEGSVKVISQAQSLVLQPGTQAWTNEQGEGLKLIPNPDMQATLAWKEGLFSYNGADIQTIMRQVARWYGVNIVYQDKITEEFVAEIPREVTLSRLLTLLEATRQVHFKIEGKTITVMK